MDPPHGVYIISEDLSILLKDWSKRAFGREFDLDYAGILEKLAKAIRTGNAFDVVTISENAISEGIRSLLKEGSRPIVSVDPVYVPSGDQVHMLHVTRCVKCIGRDFEESGELFSRHGHPAIEVQIQRLAQYLRANATQIAEVDLADDVVFSGGVIKKVIGELAKKNIRVRRVVCGIAVVASKDPFQICHDLGTELCAAIRFPRNPNEVVVDEICERDFFVFAPMCGRTLFGAENNIGVPYLKPFGETGKWASFDQDENDDAVSQRLLRLNVEILEQMELQLGRSIRFQDLDRQPHGVRNPEIASEELLLHLRSFLHA